MKQERAELTTTRSKERLANNLLIVGSTITLSGIGLITSGGTTENPRLLAAGGAVMAVGLLIFSAGRVASML